MCAFGALIKEPLLSEYEMLNVHPVAAAALARRGADRARDHGRRRAHRASRSCALTAGLDSGPVCAAGRPSRSARRTPTARSPRDWRELGGRAARRARSTERPPCAEQDDGGVTYAEKIAAEDRLLDPARPAAELERVVRALTPHIGAQPPLADGDAARRAARRAALEAGPAAGRALARRAAPGARVRRRGARAARRPAAGPARDDRRRLPARPPELRGRRVAGARVRARRRPPGVRAGRVRRSGAAAEARAPGSTRATARSRCGSRTGPSSGGRTLDHVAGRLVRRPLAELDPPCWRRSGSGCSSCCSSTAVADHAAVNESVELAKRASRGGAGLRQRGAAPGDARGAGAARRARRRRRRRAPRSCTRFPSGWPAVVARARRRPRRARCCAAVNEPAESALRVNTLVRHARRGRGGARRCRAPRRPGCPRGSCSTRPFDATARRCGGRARSCPSRAASMLVARTLAPEPGERVLDLCAAPGAKTTHLAALMGTAASVVAVERHPGRARGARADVRADAAPPASASSVGDAAAPAHGARFDRVLVDPPCSGLGTLQSRPDLRWRASPEAIAELAALQRGSSAAGAAALRPGGVLVYSVCTISRAESERRGRAVSLAEHRRDFELRRARPAPAARTATAPTASSSPACAGCARAVNLNDGERARRSSSARVPELRRAVAAADGGARPLPLRLLPAALRARVGVPQLRRALDDRADVEHRDRRLQPLPGQHAAARSRRASSSAAARAARRAVDPVGRLRAARLAGRRGARRRRPGDPRRRDGRPLRAADHVRPAGRRRARRPRARRRRDHRRPPDDRAARAPRRASSPRPAPTASRSTSRRPRTSHYTLGADPRGRLHRRRRDLPGHARRTRSPRSPPRRSTWRCA